MSETRFRVPDLMVASLPNRDDRIVRTLPVLCIEVLSSEDRMSKIQERLNDYARMGVPAMWVIDPWRGTAFAAARNGVLREVKDALTVSGRAIRVAVPEMFAELERLERRAQA